MKLIFIHGFIEDNTIFNEIRKIITQGEQIALDLETVLADWHDAPTDLDVEKMATYLVKKYNITAQDCVIGHSMGGWIATYIKQACGCKAILIASFTDQKKLIIPLKNPTLMKFLIRCGLVQGSLIISFLKKGYKFQESKKLYDELLNGMKTLNKKILYQQFQILLAPVNPLNIIPDLRIHARKDNIVRFPAEEFVEVLGDHFSVIYHAEQVITAIQKVL